MEERIAAIDRFYSDFLTWAFERGYPKRTRSRLSSALRHAVQDELPSRDSELWVQLRPLRDSDGLRLTHTSDDLWAYVGDDDRVWTGATFPSWRAGWQNRDPEVKELLRDFFHLASQYVVRSRVSSFVGAIALTYRRGCDFRSDRLSHTRFRTSSTATCRQQAVAYRDANIMTSIQPSMGGAAQRRFLRWVDELNAFDPFVQRAVFQFWRSRVLADSDFWEDSVNALDGCVSVISQFAAVRLRVKGNARSQLASVFSLPRHEQRVLDELYRLRSHYGGHPSPAKWWDFAEMYDEFLDESVDIVTHLVGGLAAAERADRKVDPTPAVWSAWFMTNAPTVLDSVWYLNV